MEKEMQTQQRMPDTMRREPVQWKVAVMTDKKMSMTVVFPEPVSEVPDLVKSPSPMTE